MGIQYAGEYRLDECTLITSKGIRVNLVHTIVQVDIFEDITRNTLSGSLLVADTNGIISNAQIIGQEYLSLKITTPSLDDSEGTDKVIDFTQNNFLVYRIGARFDVSKNAEVFELSFVSPEMVRNQRTRLAIPFTETNSNIFENVMRKRINTKKKLFIEPTIGIKKYVVPNEHPFEFISTLLLDSQSAVNGSPHYLFYETTSGYHFRTLQSLYNQNYVAELNDGDVGTLSDGTTKVRQIDREFSTVLAYEIANNNDMIQNVGGGVLGAKTIEYNIFSKSYRNINFGYFDNFKDFDRINGADRTSDNPIYSEGIIDDEGNNVGNFTDARIYMYPVSSNSQGVDTTYYNNTNQTYSYSPNQVAKTISARRAKLFEMNSMYSATVTVNGHTGYEVGQIVHMSRPGGTAEVDEEYSGRFLITKLRHTFSQTTLKHEITMNITKDSSVGVDSVDVRQPQSTGNAKVYLDNY